MVSQDLIAFTAPSTSELKRFQAIKRIFLRKFAWASEKRRRTLQKPFVKYARLSGLKGFEWPVVRSRKIIEYTLKLVP